MCQHNWVYSRFYYQADYCLICFAHRYLICGTYIIRPAKF
jgi:hypothetical protein